MFHRDIDPGWGGPTGFYRIDYRALPAPDTGTTWTPIYLWADPDAYDQPLMSLSLLADTSQPPPADRSYWVELLSVPKDVAGAPPVGTIWPVPLNRTLSITVPTYATHTGLDGYRFAFHVGAAPEPAAAAIALIIVAAARRRRWPRTIAAGTSGGTT